jgi:predicted Zn-dependent protease
MNFQQRLKAAIGYMNLDMTEDALQELETLPEPESQRPEVQALRTAILMRRREWDKALRLASSLCRSYPDHPSPFLDAAFCLHELKRTAEAKEVLLSGPRALRATGIFHYNMACYEAQLGNLSAARDYLGQAVRMDDRYREMALHDPDLEPLRKQVTS